MESVSLGGGTMAKNQVTGIRVGAALLSLSSFGAGCAHVGSHARSDLPPTQRRASDSTSPLMRDGDLIDQATQLARRLNLTSYVIVGRNGSVIPAFHQMPPLASQAPLTLTIPNYGGSDTYTITRKEFDEWSRIASRHAQKHMSQSPSRDLAPNGVVIDLHGNLFPLGLNKSLSPIQNRLHPRAISIQEYVEGVRKPTQSVE